MRTLHASRSNVLPESSTVRRVGASAVQMECNGVVKAVRRCGHTKCDHTASSNVRSAIACAITSTG